MEQKSWKRLGAAMLTVAMLLSVVPSDGFAVDVSEQTAEETAISAETDRVAVQSGDGFAADVSEQSAEVSTAPTEAVPVAVQSDESIAPETQGQPEEETTEQTYQIQVTAEEGHARAYTFAQDQTDATQAAPGQTVYLEFDDSDMTPGTAFVQWVDDSGNLTDLQYADSYSRCSFTMPEGDVRIHAQLRPNCPTITVENGALFVMEGDALYELNHSSVSPQRSVLLSLDDDRVLGQVFEEWYVKSGDVVLNDPTDRKNCGFVVPEGDVEIGMKCKPGGWQRDDCGWKFIGIDGYNTIGWAWIDGSRYCFDLFTGYMQTGWYNEFDHWYYLAPSGEMLTGWQKINGYWYYMSLSGDMLTGWQKINGYWYYMSPSGDMLTGWQKINGYWYYMSPSGDMLTGWQKINGYWYYMSPSGDMLTGWQKINGYWYYMSPSGDMLTGWQKINGYWYYMSPSGDMLTGWQKINGYWYYMSPSGDMLTGWQKINGYWYYMSPSGDMLTGWQVIDGSCYYFSPSGDMASNPLVWPCTSSYISSPFGNRRKPTGGASSVHSGIDIPAPSGSAIYAATSGTVVCAGYNHYLGNYIEISDGNGMKTIYMHCKALYVRTGDWVSAGQHIAAVGNTGISTASHLHFGVMINGCYVDPECMWP